MSNPQRPTRDRTASTDAARIVRRRRRAVRTALGAVLVAASAGVLFRSEPSNAATLNATATITDPGSGQPLASGGSETVFTVTLPSGAACSGDTANDGYHVYSYLVTKGTSLSGVKFVNFPSVGYGFVDNTGTYYGPANTAINTGQVIGIPTNFEWAPLTNSVPLSTLLGGGSSATWEAGIACADTNGNLTDNWNVELTFNADGSDSTGFTWTTAGGGGGTTTTTSAGGTTTTDAGATTTTDAGATTTTDAGATTTTSGDTTTTSAGDTTTTSAGDTTTSFTDSTVSLLGDGGGGGGTGGGGGSLAFTGSPASHYLAIAMLLLGLGLMLIGTDLTARGRRTLETAWRALR